jgi:endonuclease/exonuclease/phosphatase family metal-dependent hydrolase
MISFRDLNQRFDPVDRTGLRLQASLVSPSQPPPAVISLRAALTAGAGLARIRRAPLKAITQNTALFPYAIEVTADLGPLSFDVTKRIYEGCDRRAALATLVEKLRNAKADIVGLTECWCKADRDRIAGELVDVYPHALPGPARGIPLSVAALGVHSIMENAGIALEVPLGSGLLLLSRHPIRDSDSTQYVHATGLDGVSTKGAMHARIAVPLATGEEYEYDVFLTHLQGPTDEYPAFDAGGTDASSEDKRLWQLRHLASFIRSRSGPERPVLLMGDLNVKEDQLETMRTILPPCVDLWTVCGVPPADVAPTLGGSRGASGVTLDDANTFKGAPDKLQDRYLDPSPVGNSRVDYLLSSPGNTRKPRFSRVDLLTWKTAAGNGNDISDHYGLMAEQTHILEPAFDATRTIRKVVIFVQRFHCMRVTGFVSQVLPPSRTDNDEVSFKLRARSEREETIWVTNHTTYNGVTRGASFPVVNSAADPIRLELGDPGAWLDISVTGDEHDIGSDSLGEGSRRIWREALIRQGIWTYDYVLPRLTGDEGEYALTVSVTVELA